MIKKLAPYMKKYKTPLILGVLCAALEATFELLIPLVMAQIVDVGISTGDTGYTIKMGLLMVVMAAISLSFGLGLSKFSAIAGQGFGAELRQAEYEKIQSYSFKNIEKFSTASLITRLTTDITMIQNSLTMGIKLLVRAPMMLIVACILSVTISPKLAMIFLVSMPVLIISIGLIIKNVKPRFEVMQGKIDNLNTTVQENLIGIRVVKSFVRCNKEKEKFKASNDNLLQASEGAFSIVVLNMPIMQVVVFASVIGILWFGGNMVYAGTLTVGKLTSFMTYSFQILMSLMMLSMVLMMMSRAVASAQRIIEVLEEKPDIKDPVNPITEVKDGEIEFRNVNFRYEDDSDENNLEAINIKIKAGETVGIIGSTGSGKSSLVQLIPRLYDATEGEVYVGGVNVKDYHIETLRNEVAMVLQKNTLFSGTIKENLMWGNENATDAEIEAAATSACVDEFIDRLPGRYDMHIEQGGVNVSGGQKQRLCIARAILKQPKVLILDDSTSAVDTATDAKIRKAFVEDLKDTTKIIIAQRVNSVATADKIIVMDDGKISAIGTHDELMESSEIYKDVYKSQQEGVGLRE
ncbi:MULTISPECIES: ABC transporter ATP-binding protein [unclassified Clostridium]|uniref:ABC transporter ATP-binding protein n=1 Tax=Clostridium TaxID=1485 RepID=UPI001C8BE555|nr:MULTISPECIES: ABC transporter ATP-binding protein [unclassified Clostridium]MBX9136382.1 ABC transporter ATP-binding protein [Clostridium sp. K12(2020)]MBX9143346.1 ABC transporter ATP-binding protein [Clostridium sp. K13]MDU2290650.1 ABC transporter ATP-binding protein [Clostridium celatum]MDU4324049.1 ABC transporter ATP-binding protein [Clostridium celatum]